MTIWQENVRNLIVAGARNSELIEIVRNVEWILFHIGLWFRPDKKELKAGIQLIGLVV